VHASGGELRVIFITDGENNPWPQRFTERKFFLASGDRAAWGAMRRREALCSLSRLGVGERSAIFLAFPDQGLAKLARRGDMRLRDALRAIVEEFQPTLIVSPSTYDMHSDHRAIAYYAHAAAPDAAITTYVVHGQGRADRLLCRLDLAECEQQRKRDAIACHASQLALSRDRFLSYAGASEAFYSAEFDVVRVESAAHEWMAGFRHSMRVMFGSYPPAGDSGLESAVDLENAEPRDHATRSSLRLG
jgi:LmbE family N-acetylglucosaminyl deacetylase